MERPRAREKLRLPQSVRRSFNREDVRRRKEVEQIQIRKQKREEHLFKRRNIRLNSEDEASTQNNSDVEVAMEGFDAEFAAKVPALYTGLSSESPDMVHWAVSEIQRFLSRVRDPPIDQVIENNMVPLLVNLLSNPNELIQFEAAWALSNIASGTSKQTQTVIDAMAVPKLVKLLHSPNDNLREQAVWALGNIAGDSEKARDYVLDCGAMSPILAILQQYTSVSMVMNATWALSNLCGKDIPRPKWLQISPAIPILAKLIYSLEEDILVNACQCLVDISSGDETHIQQVVKAGVCRRITELLDHQSTCVRDTALKVVGNIASGNDNQTQMLINSGVLAYLKQMLTVPDRRRVREVCWILSNIAAGNASQIQTIIDASIFPTLIHLLRTEADAKIRLEACWAISNATSAYETRPEQVHYLVAEGCIPSLCDCLTSKNNKMVARSLEALSRILRAGKTVQERTNAPYNIYAYYVEENGGMDLISDLQMHDNPDIYRLASHVLDSYFTDGVMEDEPSIQEPLSLSH
ncbi:hypothetical protein BZG36_04667 [Bifiguratus adelaidae]|uniref:Importin subunit alpha n=1 Tax=Bifiguratus adelaidae TaxID=1938954 RepID=A0A261XWK8_9FUNG|nr:hypothetical protein BZG36_04667 [Bifiguratus adelaidae]